MAGKIHKLKDANTGTGILPLTVFDAVFDTSGKTLTKVLEVLNQSLKKEIHQVDETGFYITDSDGNIVFSITDDGVNSSILASDLIQLIEDNSTKCIKSIKIGNTIKKPIEGMLDLSKYVDSSKADFSVLNLVLMGDSITAFKNWTGTFESLLTFRSVTNIAVGNSKWSCGGSEIDLSENVTSQYNNLWNQYNRLVKMLEDGAITTVDVIIIYAGINERYGNEASWGTVSEAWASGIDYSAMIKPDTTVNTMAKSIRFTCEKIIAKFPTAKIFICTSSPLRGGYNKMEYITSVVRESAYRFSAKVIDLFREAGINDINDTIYLSDGIHLSSEGGKIIGKKIATVVKNEMIG